MTPWHWKEQWADMSIETERKGRTLVLRINRPDALNALDVESMVELNAALRAFRDDPDLARRGDHRHR